MMRRRSPSLRATGVLQCLFALLLFASPSGAANSLLGSFIDPEDGWLDGSNWLLSKQGFLPVPVVISDPAVGYGGGAAIAYFHDNTQEGAAKGEGLDGEDPELAPAPSISAVVGVGTENSSWLVGGGHFGVWKQDRIRYTGAVGYGDINIGFWVDNNDFEFNIQGVFLLQEIEFRIMQSDLFLGVGYTFLHTDIDFDDLLPPELGNSADIENAGIELLSRYDSRDNIFSPNRGHHIQLKGSFFANGLGGDFTYQQGSLDSRSWFPIHELLVLGLRLQGDIVGDGAPFYALPYINLRGIGALRYQGQKVGVVETELRWDVWKRFSVLGFVGLGWTDRERNSDEPVIAGGGGVRYLLARRLGLRTGVDIARGPEDTVVYLQVGGAW
jgi:hypothetical protein